MANELKIQQKKKHIIEALKSCLENNVYSQISLEDVAKEADFSKGGLRHYFPTREELYLGLIEDFFNQIQKDHIEIMQGMGTDDKAFISTLFGIERFLLDKKNLKIFINLILYGFEDEKIMIPIKNFIRNHLKLYEGIINDVNKETLPNKEIQLIGRITQIILLCAGLFESIDPIEMETPKLIHFILKLFKSTDNYGL